MVDPPLHQDYYPRANSMPLPQTLREVIQQASKQTKQIYNSARQHIISSHAGEALPAPLRCWYRDKIRTSHGVCSM